MSLYAKVENNEVTNWGNLPRSYQNVSGFNKLSNEQLKEYNFLPLTINSASYDQNTEKLGSLVFTINANDVTAIHEVVAKSSEEMEDYKELVEGDVSSKLTELLYDTDWSQLDGAGLSQAQKDAYDALRSDANDLRDDLSEVNLEDLLSLRSKLDAAKECACARLKDFSQPMTDLASELANLNN